jgi:hypothetical protein
MIKSLAYRCFQMILRLFLLARTVCFAALFITWAIRIPSMLSVATAIAAIVATNSSYGDAMNSYINGSLRAFIASFGNSANFELRRIQIPNQIEREAFKFQNVKKRLAPLPTTYFEGEPLIVVKAIPKGQQILGACKAFHNPFGTSVIVVDRDTFVSRVARIGRGVDRRCRDRPDSADQRTGDNAGRRCPSPNVAHDDGHVRVTRRHDVVNQFAADRGSQPNDQLYGENQRSRPGSIVRSRPPSRLARRSALMEVPSSSSYL